MNFNRNADGGKSYTGRSSNPLSTTTKRSAAAAALGPRSLQQVTDSIRLIDDLKFFLATAPANWQENQVIRRYYLNTDEGFVSCVFWNNLYFITGTDIVRCMVYKFEHFGRQIIDRKKFEEGVFSDLRNLKCGNDAVLELPKSEFLEFLFKNSCLRTQKKQKVFFWFNVPHDKLMAEALERDLKKERLNMTPTTVAKYEPALSFQYDESCANIHSQLSDYMESQTAKYLPGLAALTNPPPLANPFYAFANNPPFSASSTSDSTHKTDSLLRAALDFTAKSTSPEYPADRTAGPDKSGKLEYLGQPSLLQYQLTPQQFQADPAYENDFPLDYFDFASANANDYLNLDPSFHQPGAFPNHWDPAMMDQPPHVYTRFPRPKSAVPNPSNLPIAGQVLQNDDYLIEQSVPYKPSLASFPTSGYLPPRSAIFAQGATVADDFFRTAVGPTPHLGGFSPFFKSDLFGYPYHQGPGASYTRNFLHPLDNNAHDPHYPSPTHNNGLLAYEPEAWGNGLPGAQIAGTFNNLLPPRTPHGYEIGRTDGSLLHFAYPLQQNPSRTADDQATITPLKLQPDLERLCSRRGQRAPLFPKGGVRKPPLKTGKTNRELPGGADEASVLNAVNSTLDTHANREASEAVPGALAALAEEDAVGSSAV